MQRYNITLSDEEYKDLKIVAENFGVPISKVIKRLVRVLVKSGMKDAKDDIYIFGLTENGAWATDIRSGEDIRNLQGGIFDLRYYRDKKTRKPKCRCDFRFLSEKRIFTE